MAKIIDNSEVGVRSNQNLSNNWLGTTDFGVLRPFYWTELLGTDKVKICKPKIELQLLPLASPTFGHLDLYVHYFAVPTRLLWSQFEDFYSQAGSQSSATPPFWTRLAFREAYECEAFGWDTWSESGDTSSLSEERARYLYKHWTSFGLPPFFSVSAQAQSGIQPIRPAGTNPDTTADLNTYWGQKISLLPFRAYNKIWFDFYRDTELIPDSNEYLYCDTSGNNRWNGSASLNYYLPKVRSIKDCWIAELFANNGVTPLGENVGLYTITGAQGSQTNIFSKVGASAGLRKIEALTRLAERLSMSGKRQIDKLYNQYGIKPEWTKLKMAQYIGGAKTSIRVQDITSSADTTLNGGIEGAALGQKAAQGYAVLDNLNIKYEAKEPCILMGILSVMPKIHFVQGLGREWFRNSLYDWYRRELEHVGQVAVPCREVAEHYQTYVGGQSPWFSEDTKTFAFTRPYYDYCRKQDVLAGDFMWYHHPTIQNYDSQDVKKVVGYMGSMNMYQDFPVDRKYNAQNLQLNSKEANKIFFYQGGSAWENVDDHFHIDVANEVIIERPMDGYAVPTLETTEDPHKKTAPVVQSVQL